MKHKFLVAEKIEANDTERSIVGWGSKPVADRDKELIKADAWLLDQYRKNPVLMLCHDYSTPPVGKCLWVKADSNGLKFKAQFASTERGKEIYQLYKEGVMNAFSVGFSPDGYEDNPTAPEYKGLKRVYTKATLLEISCVPVPANSEALVEYVKSGKITCKQLKDELDHVIEVISKGNSPEDENLTFYIPIADAKEGELNVKEISVKIEVNENTIRIPNPESKDDHTDHKVRTISLSDDQGVKALYCVTDKEIVTYLFDKEKWSLDDAKAWVKDHKENKSTTFVIALVEPEEVKDQKKDPTDTKVEPEEKTDPTEGKTKEVSGTKEKMLSPEGQPSVFDIMSAIGQTLNMNPFSSSYSYVVDLYPSQFPDGQVIYFDASKYFSASYMYDKATNKALIGEEKKEVQMSWITDRYGDVEGPARKSEEGDDVVLKIGRTFSAKNREVIDKCAGHLAKMASHLETTNQVHTELKGLLDYIDGKVEPDGDENEDKGIFEIVSKESEDNVIEIDGLDDVTIKKAVSDILDSKNMSSEIVKGLDLSKAVEEIVSRLKGKVVA